MIEKVLLEFDSIKTKDALRSNVGVGSRFLALRQASNELIAEGRIAWVEVEGIPFKFWSKNTFNKIATKWGRLLDVDDQNESNFHSKRLCLRTQLCSNVFKSFKVVFRGKVYWVRAKEVPGWILEESEEDVFLDEGISNKMNDGGEVPDIDEVPETDFEETDEINGDQAKSVNGDNPNDKSNDVQVEHDRNSIGQASKIANSDSIGPRRFKKSDKGLSMNFLSLSVQGLAQKAKKDWVKELCIKNKVNIVVLQENKNGSIDLFSVKRCWGNLAFESNLLIVVVYAPHDYRDKCILWDYLSHVSNQWNEDVVMMGDFNEVRHKSNRFGSVFNAHGADIFNFFINKVGLEEIQLGG
nr:RNA-directed DNA polymerase, eukaryota [Tanacetum cinerariifolium]